MSQAPPRAGRCRACAAAIDPGSARCPRCGAAQQEETCPHCGGVGGSSPHPELRFRCDLCGGPRVPLTDSRFKRSGRELSALQQARAAASSRAGWRAAGVAGGVLFGFELFVFALLLLVLGASAGLVIAGLATMVPVALFALWALQRARARGREIAPALDAAWVAVAADIAGQLEEAPAARDLAALMGLAEPQAEELLALLEVNDLVRGATPPGGGPRLRVGDRPGLRVDAGDDASALAENEALAEGQDVAPPPRRNADEDPAKR